MIYSIPFSELHRSYEQDLLQYKGAKTSEIRQLLEKYLLYLTIFVPSRKNDETFNSLLLCFDYDDSNLFYKMRKLSIDDIRDTIKSYASLIYIYWNKVPLIIKIICVDVISVNKQTLESLGLSYQKTRLFLEFKKRILKNSINQ